MIDLRVRAASRCLSSLVRDLADSRRFSPRASRGFNDGFSRLDSSPGELVDVQAVVSNERIILRKFDATPTADGRTENREKRRARFSAAKKRDNVIGGSSRTSEPRVRLRIHRRG